MGRRREALPSPPSDPSDPSELARGVIDEMAVLRTDITTCRACPRLVAWREQVADERRAAYRNAPYWGRPVPGFGDPRASVLVIGLAPAAHGANRTGRVFTGDRSGDWLYRAMHKAGYANQPTSTHADDGLTLHDAYVSAVVRCAPPSNKPTPDERDHCVPFLRRELAVLDAVRVYVVLGQFAYDALTKILGVSPRPRFGHLVEVATPDGRTMVCSYHPSQQNTFTGTLTEPMFDAVFARARVLSSASHRANGKT